jgi:hypothetical protein
MAVRDFLFSDPITIGFLFLIILPAIYLKKSISLYFGRYHS